MTNYLVEHWQELYKQAEALAASRLELLRRNQWASDGEPILGMECIECGGLYPNCKDGCELAEELDDG